MKKLAFNLVANDALLRRIKEEKRKQYENSLKIPRWEEYQEAGQTISNSVMTAWIKSWGTDQETSPPTI